MADPMYRQIADDLRYKIESGEVAPGDRLPTEIQLMDRYSASRNTVRSAISLLITRGLIETRAGQGTFVVEKIAPIIIRLGGDPEIGESTLYRQETASDRRFESSLPRVEVQTFTSPVIQEELLLSDGSSVISRHQDLFLDSIPWALQTSFYPMQLVEMGATRLIAAQDIESGTINYLRDTLGIKQVGWNERVAVRTPDDNEIAFFRLPEDGRISLIENIRTAYDKSGRPLRATVTRYPSDRVQFVMAVGEVPAPIGWAAGTPGAVGDRAEAPSAVQGRMADVRAPAVVALER